MNFDKKIIVLNLMLIVHCKFNKIKVININKCLNYLTDCSVTLINRFKFNLKPAFISQILSTYFKRYNQLNCTKNHFEF
jgi:hypothetical protein